MIRDVRLSVVVPGHNTPEEWWRRSIISVLAALEPQDELICVDDGSTVDTRWIDELARQDPRCRILRFKTNQGVSCARNEAVKVSRGKYITFVDSDDEVSRECFKRCLREFDEGQVDVVMYGVKVIWVNDGLCRELVLPTTDYGVLTARSLSVICQACLFDYTCNKIYRREFLIDHGIMFEKNVTFGEDVKFNLACVMAKANWRNVNHVGYVYYRRDGTALGSYLPNLVESCRCKAEAWRKCACVLGGDIQFMAKKWACTDQKMAELEWANLWRKNSPIGLCERWNYLLVHRSVTTRPLVLEYVYRLAYSFVRQHFYFRSFRRHHIRKLYPDVKKWEGETWS